MHLFFLLNNELTTYHFCIVTCIFYRLLKDFQNPYMRSRFEWLIFIENNYFIVHYFKPKNLVFTLIYFCIIDTIPYNSIVFVASKHFGLNSMNYKWILSH